MGVFTSRDRATPAQCECRSRLRASPSQDYAATYHRTAHEPPPLATVRCRQHPFHGEEVEILRRARDHKGGSVLVRVRQNGVQLTLPAWMLDDGFCAQLRYGTEPLVVPPALIALRELLDAQPLLASVPEKQQRRRVANQGGDHAPKHLAAHVALRAPGDLGEASGRTTPTVPGPLPAAPASGDGARRTGEGGGGS